MNATDFVLDDEIEYKYYHNNHLSEPNIDMHVKIYGWIKAKRNHGHLVFLDIRDSYSVLQCVLEPSITKNFDTLSNLSKETVIEVRGIIRQRKAGTYNSTISTGTIELLVHLVIIISEANVLPFDLEDNSPSDDLRLAHRFLDLRREHVKKSVLTKSKIMRDLREYMWSLDFQEIPTPIITGDRSSEGARSFIVLSSLKKGVYYTLPQSPQIFKQLLMVAGIPKYFQIAPCFRNEDSRADRSPGEFYQLDIEMSFIKQSDIITLVENIMRHLFGKFGYYISHKPFVQIEHNYSINQYGCDKPDFRNPLVSCDVTDIFANSSFAAFQQQIANGKIVKAIAVPPILKSQANNFDIWAKSEHMPGMGYVSFGYDIGWSIAKHLQTHELEAIHIRAFQALEQHFQLANFDENIKQMLFPDRKCTIFFLCGYKSEMPLWIWKALKYIAQQLQLIDQNQYAFCWVINKPMYELNEKTGQLDFGHNPFSMPMVTEEEFDTINPLDIKSHQYDIVLNSMELGSGAIRNYKIDLMYKIFGVVGYSKQKVDQEFAALKSAFSYGAPIHGGIGLGIERIAMILSKSESIRDVMAFPLNQSGNDLLMRAPTPIDKTIAKDYHLLEIMAK